MRKILLVALFACLLVFSSSDCVTTLQPQATAAATSITEERRIGNYIGRNLYEVLQVLGNPTETGRCQISLPVTSEMYNNRKLIRGEGLAFHKDGQQGSYSIHTLTELCAVFGTIIAQHVEIIEKDTNEETIFNIGRSDYILLRKLLEEGSEPEEQGREYILKPGEHAI
jgi:hypothetical protein